MKHLINIAELALGTLIGAVCAEAIAVLWLRRHRPHINKDKDIEL